MCVTLTAATEVTTGVVHSGSRLQQTCWAVIWTASAATLLVATDTKRGGLIVQEAQLGFNG